MIRIYVCVCIISLVTYKYVFVYRDIIDCTKHISIYADIAYQINCLVLRIFVGKIIRIKKIIFTDKKCISIPSNYHYLQLSLFLPFHDSSDISIIIIIMNPFITKVINESNGCYSTERGDFIRMLQI